MSPNHGIIKLMAKKTIKEKSHSGIVSIVAKSDEGTIQVTFTIPFLEIKSARNEVATEEAKFVEIPGFRKGKAPVERVMARIPQATLIEKTIAKFYAEILKQIIETHKLKPITYPKIEVVKINEDEDWIVKAVTCEMPEVELGDVRSEIIGLGKSKAIWIPGADKKDKPQEPTREIKEQMVLSTLLEKVTIKIPKLLIDEEVSSRLSHLLERIEKLGLTLENYLKSIGKNAEQLKAEYQKQATDSISLELILGKIAEAENIKVEESQIDEAIKAASGDTGLAHKLEDSQQRTVVRNILTRRSVLDSLVALL